MYQGQVVHKLTEWKWNFGIPGIVGVGLKMQSIRSEARERTRVRVVVRLRPVNGECAVQVTGALD
jgi:hypothetical protein